MTGQPDDRKNLLAVNLGLAANVLLALLKTAVGIVGSSPALLADGINSSADVVYSAVVRVFMGLARKPPDREHPYGHRQLESIAGLVVGAFVVTTAVAMFWYAAGEVYHLAVGRSRFTGAHQTALWVALLTVVLKVGLTVFTRRIARQTGSIAVLALARDHQNDIFSISAAALGIFLGLRGYPWVDPLAAALVALVILGTGVSILRESSADLMDVLPDRQIRDQIYHLLEAVPGVHQIEEVHIHRIGLYLLVEVTLGVDGALTVAAGDQIASRAEQVLWKQVQYLRRVSIHYHPSRERPAAERRAESAERPKARGEGAGATGQG